MIEGLDIVSELLGQAQRSTGALERKSGKLLVQLSGPFLINTAVVALNRAVNLVVAVKEK